MRILVISDIHANLTAFSAVLEDAKPYEGVWCLGDVVGYGPDPNECVERLRSLPGLKCVKGNHDAAILGEIDINAFNHEARLSLDWLASKLRVENRRWLSSLEEKLVFDNITLVHGSPRNPVWEYIMDVRTARDNMPEFTTGLCMVGHTHIPCIFQMTNESLESTRMFGMIPGVSFTLDGRVILNPGSVGQPRDHDPRASYMIFDTESGVWVNYRVAYDFKAVQDRIRAAGLPVRHASRLEAGW